MDRLYGDHLISALREIDTPTICNGIELFEIRPRTSGYVDGSIHAAFPDLPPMVGYATTASFRASAQPAEADLYTTISNQVRHFKGIAQPRIVVFEDLDVPPVAATFGEVMCTIYKTFGCAGLITSGGGRDLPQVHALEFPVFIGSPICSHGYCHLVDVNVPVRVGGLTVHPGDLLHGDCNGIALIPQEIAPELPSACERFSAIEAKLLSAIREGGPDPEALQRARAEAAEATRDLSERIRFQPD